MNEIKLSTKTASPKIAKTGPAFSHFKKISLLQVNRKENKLSHFSNA